MTTTFRQSVDNFVAALRAAGAPPHIEATRRPLERAYLMTHAWEIARGHRNPADVPPMRGVDIEWVHRDAHGAVDLAASRRAAEQMVQAYKMAHPAVLHSRHTEGRAIDMSITWSGDLHIRDAHGRTVTIRSTPRDGTNPELHAVGSTFGVRKLVRDQPHWSDDGH